MISPTQSIFKKEKEEDKIGWGTLEIKVRSDEQLKHLFNAERELLKAGIYFDTGYNFKEHERDWELDWSLRGAELKLHNGEIRKVKFKR